MSQSGTFATGGSVTGASIKTTVFTEDGTWTKDANTKYINVTVVSGGGGGGSGRRGASTNAGGGGGAGAGNIFSITLPASYFAATEAVVVGTGGTGGVPQTVNDTDGNNGTAGGISSFAGIELDFDVTETFNHSEGFGGTTGFGLQGRSTFVNRNLMDGTTSTLFAPPSTQGKLDGGSGTTTDGLNGNTMGGFSLIGCINTPTVGGGGGGADSTTERSGGDGQNSDVLFNIGNAAQPKGYPLISFATGGTGGLESGTIDGGDGNPGVQSSLNTYLYYGTGGGGGGGQSGGPVAGNGGNGGFPGGGGGGGGGSLNGTDSGAGGDGANGVVVVVEYLYP